MEQAIERKVKYLETCRNKTGEMYTKRMNEVRNTLTRLSEFVNIKEGKIADTWNPKIADFEKRLDALK